MTPRARTHSPARTPLPGPFITPDNGSPHVAVAHGSDTLLVMCGLHAGAPMGHDRQSRMNVARRLAEVMGWTFGGNYDGQAEHRRPLYFVPHDALLLADAQRLGIRGAHQLFGGVVPHAFVATKAISHPLVAEDATAPDGWSDAFARYASDTVLRGYTTFAMDDARRAASLLLARGPARVKCVSGIGGSGQYPVARTQDADTVLAQIDGREFESGVVVEEELTDGVTFSVGTVTCGGETIAYCGTQQTTRNAHGADVYGGSTLDVARGGFAALRDAALSPERLAAVDLAQAYDAAAFAAYPGAFASRRNYDVLFGRDAAGRHRIGVLEQSWRIGGASAAEVVAFAAFRRDLERTRVRCATVETYSDRCTVPPKAFVYYRGVDPRVGPLTKYALEFDGPDT